ncbi:UDP-glucose 4-epimerase GalE [Pleurocapsa sp. PCC 7319]|uniref:UDP-glucose 4-epimerase GalE n=1 Tax=Pleurocapsa sp. PCC 7319 TaxID=118161 RepID=UPI0003481944|nr:UDP-glucose 4-epimerase GalE [Pleurocapsa sp. PCC 7319]
MAKILVTGGAGYIGSHTVKKLGEAGYEIVTYDNLSTGSAEAILYGKLVTGELNDTEHLAQIFAQHQFDAVLHFAASISVPESLEKPLAYYYNNTCNVVNLLNCCQEFGVNQFVFSSTAAVYGEIKESPVPESSPTLPINPYGQSKLMSEKIIRDYAQASDLKYVILRYFNVAGADSSGKIGQMGKKAAHLIKVGCDAALGIRPSASIFGTDYPTPDGTGIRDYIHVEDLASAHVDALAYLEQKETSQILNCGYGTGYSVREVLSKIREISGVNFQINETPRRPGDPACVVASGDKVRELLGWHPQHNSLDEIVSSALAWEKKKLSQPYLV